MKKDRVTLTAQEREPLEQMLARGKADVRQLTHAQLLLTVDEAEGGPAWQDEPVAEALDVALATVPRVRQRCVEDGLEAAAWKRRPGSGGQPRPPRPADVAPPARRRTGGLPDRFGLIALA